MRLISFVGCAVRAASCYGLGQVWFTGDRVQLVGERRFGCPARSAPGQGAREWPLGTRAGRRPVRSPHLLRLWGRILTYCRSVRALVGLVEVAIVLTVLYLVYSAVTTSIGGRRRQLPTGGRWQPRHYADDGYTVMTVARLTGKGDMIEEHLVARIPDLDEDWSRKFLQAKQEAEERAFHLNADSSP
jgi:pyridoxamine 5'-phosphate oxidase family protein